VTLRVLHALAGGRVGGTETSVFALAPRLVAEGLDVEISLLDGHGPVSAAHRDGPIAIHDLAAGGGGLAGAAVRFRQLLAAGRYDVVHLYGIRMATMGRLVARTLGARPVLVHGVRNLNVTAGSPSSVRSRAVLAVERRLAHWTDAYLANSQGAMDFLTSQGLPAAKFEVIPNGLDLERWPAEAERGANRRPVAICVANFKPQKRQLDLLEAVTLLPHGVPLEVEFAGEGRTLAEARAYAAAHNIEDRVRFLGRVSAERMPAVLAAADLAVLPSLTEGMSVGLLEAMAAGLPVVATDIPGTREVVVDGVTGRLVPVRRPDLLAARLSELASDPALRVQLGAAGRRRVEQQFTLTLNVSRHLDAYRRLAAAHRTGRGHD
jgi:glycosyltransferase involved in cell wall biosynthesis